MERQPADRPPRLRKAPCSNLHERPAAKDIALDTCHVDTRRNEAGRGYRETLRHQHQRDWDACTTLREPSWHRRMNKPADMPLQIAHRTCLVFSKCYLLPFAAYELYGSVTPSPHQ